MHATVGVWLAAMVGLGCGRIGPGITRPDERRVSPAPGPVEAEPPEFAPRPCEESIQARADGAYAELDGEARRMRFGTYRGSCEQLCSQGGGAAACLEAALLAYLYPPGGLAEMVSLCATGEPQACAWVDEHREEIAANDARLAEEAAAYEYQRRIDEAIAREQAKVDAARAAVEAAEAEIAASAPLEQAVTAAKLTAPNNGYHLIGESRHSLETGRVLLVLSSVQDGGGYMIMVLANSTTPFTARVGDADIEDNGGDDLGAPVLDNGVYIRAGKFTAGGYGYHLLIRPDGGDYGEVRVLVLERD